MLKFYSLTAALLLLTGATFAQNVGIGTNAPNAKLDVAGNLALREGTALSLATGANNDIVLTAPVASVYRITGPAGSFSLSGIASGQNGQVVTLVNTTGYDLTLVNDATSSSSNRLYIPGGFSRTISGVNSVVTLQYNASLLRWIVTDITSAKDGINWSLSGNAGTNAGTNFVGTTDTQDFVIKTGGSATTNERIRATGSGDVIINEQSNATDVRIETDNDANALVVKGSSDNIGIGGTPDAKAKLDIAASDKGILIPRLALTSATAPIANPKPSGLMVYNTSTSGSYPTPGLYIWDGTDWQRVILNSTLSGSLQPLSATSGGGLQFTPGSYNGGTSTTVGIATDGINNGMLQDNIVTTNEILNGTVGTSDLATPAVNATTQIFNTLPVSNGGTGQSSLTANGVVVGNGTSAVSVTGAPSPGQALIGNASSVPTFTSLGGDVASVSGAGNVQLANTGVTAGTYGSSTKAPILTVDAKGRLTSATDVTITGTTPGGAAGGDLSGTYPNPTVAQIQGRPVTNTAPASNDVLTWNGSAWAPANKGVPTGIIVMWSGSQASIPTGWALCDGGSGTPDLRDRFVMMVTGSGGSYDVGSTGGANSITLSVAQLPAHNHTATASNAGAFTPSGTISAAGSHSHTWGGNWSNDGSQLVSSPYGDGSGNTYSDHLGSYWGTSDFTRTSSATDLTHQHQWGGQWNVQNAAAAPTYPANGDGGGNTYSDGINGTGYWGTGNVATTSTNTDHTHSWGNVWSNDDSRWEGYIISDGWAWWDAGSWSSNFSTSWAGWHGHGFNVRGSLSGWGYAYASGGGGWQYLGVDGNNGAQMIKHRHYIQGRNTGGMSANASHNHGVPNHRHWIGTFQTSNNNTGNSMNHTHTVGIPNHRHWIQQRSTSTAADHTHTFTGTAVADHTHTITINNTGSGSAIENRPAYYKLAFIMKL